MTQCECGGQSFYGHTERTEIRLHKQPVPPDITVESSGPGDEEWYCCDCGAGYYGENDPIAVACDKALRESQLAAGSEA